MKFVALAEADRGNLTAEFRSGRRLGALSLGRRHLFFRKLFTVYYLPYGAIERYFRRVEAIPARIGCCCGGELQMESLVLWSGGKELAQISLPGERAAVAALDELSRRAPDAAVGVPV